MQKVTELLGILLALLICCGELLQAMPIPPEVPGVPIYYKRLHRIRPSHKKDIDVYEIRELYYIRRTTPKPKIQALTDEELDQRIRCDFEPNLPECLKVATKTSVSRTSTTTEATSTTSTTPSTTTMATTTTTDIATTTTDIPLLPELPLEANDPVEEIETTTPSDEDDYHIIPEDENYDDEEEANTDDDINDPVDGEDYFNAGGSIGGNDLSK